MFTVVAVALLEPVHLLPVLQTGKCILQYQLAHLEASTAKPENAPHLMRCKVVSLLYSSWHACLSASDSLHSNVI